MRQGTDGDVKEIAGLPYGDRRRVAVITAPSHPAIVERLTRRAVDTLLRHGVRTDDIHVVRAPGLTELPTVTRWLVAAGRYDAIVVVGLVVRPEMPDADRVVTEAGRAITAIAASLSAPIASGLVVSANWLHADALTRDGRHDVARDAVIAGLAMADLLAQVQLRTPTGERPVDSAARARVARALGPTAHAQRPT
jgi:6,7-dimethyl-8-ribityllumazine synthase